MKIVINLMIIIKIIIITWSVHGRIRNRRIVHKSGNHSWSLPSKLNSIVNEYKYIHFIIRMCDKYIIIIYNIQQTGDCALHQFNSLRATNYYGSMPTSVADGPVWTTNSLLPICGHHQHQQPDVINGPKRTLSLPFSGGFDVIDHVIDRGDFDVNVKLAQRTLSTDKVT